MGNELLRESLEAASAELADSTSAEVAPGETAVAEPVAEVTATPATETVETTSTREDGRDDKGRFAPKATAGASKDASQAAPQGPPSQEGAASSTTQPKPAEPTTTEPPKPGEPDTTYAPPQWKIGARSSWDKVPPDIRKEVWRREVETQQALSRSAPDRQMANEIRQTLAPLERVLQARGTTPQRLISEYVKFDQALSSKDPALQAQAVAQVIKGYGIPIEVLADAIDGKLQPHQRQLSVEEIREQVRAEERANWQAQQRQTEYRNHTSKVQEFAKTVDPVLFNEDVRHDMAALIEAAAARNVELSLQDAYDRAVRANPDAWAIVQQREEAKRAATQQVATRRAEAAGSSVKSRPASPVGGSTTGNSLRADLEAVAASQSGRT